MNVPSLEIRNAGGFVPISYGAVDGSVILEQYRGTESILLVDDEPVVLTLARSILNYCGYTVHDFFDPAEALAEQQKLSFDLVLTDVVMPNLNGPELVKKLRESQTDLRCIFMSGYDLNHIGERGISPGCDYLRKPFTPETLLKKVRNTLQEDTAGRAS